MKTGIFDPVYDGITGSHKDGNETWGSVTRGDFFFLPVGG